MTAVAHDPAPADHDVTDRYAGRAEDRRVEHRVERLSSKRGIVGVEHDEIGAASRSNRAGRPRLRLRAAAGCGGVQRLAHGRVGGCKHVARLPGKPLRPLELPQLGERIDDVFESLPIPSAPRAST